VLKIIPLFFKYLTNYFLLKEIRQYKKLAELSWKEVFEIDEQVKIVEDGVGIDTEFCIVPVILHFINYFLYFSFSQININFFDPNHSFKHFFLFF